ncbi:MAG: SapB/AmfS family lanthipeptide [Pseudonocardiaceae bacterium]
MALLDLQGMETPEALSGKPPPGSRASKGCGGSGLSLLFC